MGERVLLSQSALHAGNIRYVVSDLSQDGHVPRITGHTLETNDGLRERVRERRRERETGH